MSHTPIRKLAAALLGALLFVVTMAAAQAQTITNVASASWNAGGADFSIRSNVISIDLASLTAHIDTFRPARGTGIVTPITASRCGGVALPIVGASGGSNAVASVTETTSLRAGEQLFFRVVAPRANFNPAAIDTLTAILITTDGDREEIEVFETAPNSGVFMGAIPTAVSPPAPVRGDCKLSVANGDLISIEAHMPGLAVTIATAVVDVLADPFGLIFDSEDGTPISGARVSLVDALTGAPARVFADDGVTAYPSSMISGQPVTDAAGNDYPMQPGEYRFPLAPLGQYRLVVEPPTPYSAPSLASLAQLAALTRPDGQPLRIFDGSFGRPFALSDTTPVRVDIPLDRPSLAVALGKSASRPSATPGDVVFYTITARNQDEQRIKRQVTLIDTPSPWLRLRSASIRVDGVAAPAAVTVSPTGRGLTIALGDIAPGATRTVTYAMTVRADAPPGQAVNRAEATDSRGNRSIASATLRIERETIAGRMTLIGRITRGDCSVMDPREGIAGVRVMLEDGSFAITDTDGRYHFEGLTPGTHVVQAQSATLPRGGRFVDCARSTRTAGKANSRFVTGQGGSLVVADFSAISSEYPVATNSIKAIVQTTDQVAAGAETDFLAAGDGPIDWLFPALDHNPRAPAVRVAIRHRAGQTVALAIDGKPVDALAFDGARTAPAGSHAVSVWRGIPLERETTRLTAIVRNADGSTAATLARDVHFAATPARVEIVREASHLVANGAIRPVLGVRVLDRSGRPVHAGIAGSFAINAPYESAQALDAMQTRVLSGLDRATPAWTVKGDDGIALIELAPTMVSGSLRVDFAFSDGEVRRRQTLEGWVVPGAQEWTLVGLAEGSIGARTVADNMERSGNFDSDLGNKARVAFYAKGRVLGRFLMTLAYDSAKQRDDQRLLGAIDPDAYYTVFADGSGRRFDAASRNKLYVRIETAAFYALFGDFETGFDATELARYNRAATGFKGEAQVGRVRATGFAAKIASRHRRDEIQGNGLSGPYRLSSRAFVANSETVAIERRDRFRSEKVIERRTLTRFIDYDIDVLSGTISFTQPILSRDADLNPQFIVVDFEVDELRSGATNAGLRADWTSTDERLRIGATAITDKGDGARTELVAVDLRARIGAATELRAEAAMSHSAGASAKAWTVEAEHHSGPIDLLAYARSLDEDFGLAQQNRAERGRRKIGVDARARLSEGWSLTGSAWRDTSLSDATRRNAVELRSDLRRGKTDARLGIAHFSDLLNDGRKTSSTVLEAGATRRMLDNRLELDGATSVALGKTGSVDLPARHRFGARYAVTSDVKLLGTYEIAQGDAIDARTARVGFEIAPWAGAKLVSTLGQEDIREQGKRSFAAFGLAQSWQVTPKLTVDATLDGNRELGGFDASRVVNPDHPVASGGHLGESSLLGEDFTAVTLGGAYRAGQWSATLRGELRNGEFADRRGVTFGAIRQLGEGSVVGSGLSWTRATTPGGAATQVFDAAVSAAYRPADAAFAALGKLEYRSDSVTGAVAGEVGPAGRTALTVTGDAQSRRLIASLSTNWSPRGKERTLRVQRSELGLFVGMRYNFDHFQGFELGGFTALGGLDARLGLGERFELGAVATVRTNLSDRTTAFAVGPQIGFSPTRDALVTVGYNITGFRDRDFAAARSTDKGLYAAIKLKFDADSFAFLGLGR